MSNDELETRITLMETRYTTLLVLVHCVLPAIDPNRRHHVMEQFQQHARARQQELEQSGLPVSTVNMHLTEVATIYKGLQGALELIAKNEAKG